MNVVISVLGSVWSVEGPQIILDRLLAGLSLLGKGDMES